MTRSLLAVALLLTATPVMAQSPDAEFFETRIRPVLVQRCYSCHSSKLTAPMADLTLDTKEGLLKGGHSGPAIVPGNAADSLLLKALTYAATPQMPPTGKLPDAVIADFEQWIAKGALDPRTEAATTSAASKYKGMSIEEGRKWWAFQPVVAHDAPKVRAAGWPKTKSDSFMLAKLEEKKLKPSPAADRRTLAIRAYIDLVGYRPTFEEIQAFLNDRSATAYETLIDRLLASPRYGETMGPPLDGCGALRRRQSDVGSDQPSVSLRVAISRLGHRGHERRSAVRPVREAATRGGSDAGRSARRSARARLSGSRSGLSQGSAAVGRRDRHVLHRRLG